MLNREDVNNSLIMIQPTLMSYSMEAPTQPVLLDSVSIQPNVILLLDTFFHVLIWHDETVAAWRKAKYQDDPTYAGFKNLLEMPRADAQVWLLHDMFVSILCPKYFCGCRMYWQIDSLFLDILILTKGDHRHDFCFQK